MVAKIEQLTILRDSIQSDKDKQDEFTDELEGWEKKFDRADLAVKKAMLINIIESIWIKGDELTVRFKLKTMPDSLLKPLSAFEALVSGCVPPDHDLEEYGNTISCEHPYHICSTRNAHLSELTTLTGTITPFDPTLGPNPNCVQRVRADN